MRKYHARTAEVTVSRPVMILAFIMLVMSGCIPIGPPFPAPSPNFAPRKEYNSSFETVWKTVHDVFEDNRIAVATSNKNDGRITTEYIAGQDQLMVLSPMGTRYRYSIRISSADGKSTRLNIASYLESSTGSYQTWHDVTNENKGIISKLENGLYEQIETRLLTRATSAPDLNEQVTKPNQRDSSSIQSSSASGRVLESFVDPTNAQIVFAISDSQSPPGQYLLRSENMEQGDCT
jgi:hypothetical protein